VQFGIFLSPVCKRKDSKKNKTVTLLVILYGCETWSLKLRKEHSLRVSGNRVLRRVFGHKRDEVTGGYKKYMMYNELLRLRMEETASRYGG
jgi:hypothetical protein